MELEDELMLDLNVDLEVDDMAGLSLGTSEGKSGLVSHTKHTAEATNMDLFHS